MDRSVGKLSSGVLPRVELSSGALPWVAAVVCGAGQVYYRG
ncbi:hypothetical protein [Micromonospora sp. NPDC023633]